MTSLSELLQELYDTAIKKKLKSAVKDESVKEKAEYICRCTSNKAPIRFLMACLLAKIDKPEKDIRKPYTEISGDDTFSGRHYDEEYIQRFVQKYNLPCNSTTAFLTPAFRNIDRSLTPDLVLVGRPKEVYTYTLELIDFIYKKKIKPLDLLSEIIRFLIIIKNENESRMQQLLKGLKQSTDFLPLSSEQIVKLLQQHLDCKNSSRLPVLMICAAYKSVQNKIGESFLPLQSHNAADKQTGSIGDVEVTLVNDEKIVTCYEMKDKRVSISDINQAIAKIENMKYKINNYIFITTDFIELEVVEYSNSLYEQTGIEFATLDCIGFIRHFLHFFHRQRIIFLNNYQELVLSEPDSSVTQPLKEAFLVLRRTAESDK